MGPAEIEAHARRVEALGYDGLCVPDAVHDGLLLAQAALRASQRMKVATSVLVCFPRSPMQVAIAAWDLQAVSGGRFELGLGTQVKGNIERRYGASWTAPVPRMREYLQSLRAIWHSFQTGAPLRFEGEHYQLTRLQPFFNPGPIEWPEIPIHLGAIGPRLTELAGELADGWMTHPSNTSARFLRELGRPSLEAGARRSGRDLADFTLLAGGFIATGRDAAAVTQQREWARGHLGFLYSTPAYWRSLELFGWGEVGKRLHALSREGKWAEMTAAIDDAMLDAFVPSGDYRAIADAVRNEYGGLAQRVNFPVPEDPVDDALAAEAIAALRG